MERNAVKKIMAAIDDFTGYGTLKSNSTLLLKNYTVSNSSEIIAHQINQTSSTFSVYEINLQRKKSSKMTIDDIKNQRKGVFT